MILLLIFTPHSTCGRCKKEIPEAETCWFCMGNLCEECWELYGHCGHEDADRLNRASRMLNAEGRAFLMQSLLPPGGN